MTRFAVFRPLGGGPSIAVNVDQVVRVHELQRTEPCCLLLLASGGELYALGAFDDVVAELNGDAPSLLPPADDDCGGPCVRHCPSQLDATALRRRLEAEAAAARPPYGARPKGEP